MPNRMTERAIVFSHRGARDRFPENTLGAFRRALALGADVLETDVRLSRDGRVVCFHDEDLTRLVGTAGAVEEVDWDQLRSMNVRAGLRQFDLSDFSGEPPHDLTIPEFRTVLREFPATRFNVDLKSEDPHLARAFATLLREEQALDRVTVASFHTAVLEQFRRITPEATTSAHRAEAVDLVRAMTPFGRRHRVALLQSPATAFQLPYRYSLFKLIRPSLVRKAHDVGKEVHVWTINDPLLSRRLLQMGVDGIITDRVDLIRPVVDSENRSVTHE